MLPTDVRIESDGSAVHATTGEKIEVGRSEKMSKSKRNVVDPEEILASYGADTARLFMLSDSPPKHDLDWTDAGVDGAWRYINRLWRLIGEPVSELAPCGAPEPSAISAEGEKLRRAVHKTIAAVSDDLEKFHFNKAVARIRELTNQLEAFDANSEGGAWVFRLGCETVVKLIGPMMPHLAEELWQRLGCEGLLVDASWPEYDKVFLEEATVTIAVQVNGKLRGTIDVPKDSAKEDVESAALGVSNVVSAMSGKTPRKVIVVPNRIVNVVV